jgi:MYXO-CTERM domain-containing protein
MSIPRFVVLAASILAATTAQSLEVIQVPWVATDPTVPHLAYNGHATTFKAIARGGNGTYFYEWDFQGDGGYDFSATTTDRYNLSTRFTFPNQAADMTFQAKVRVTSGGQTVVGTYPVRVFAEVPSDPAAANDRQLQVQRSVAIDDGLWFLHKQMSRAGDETHPLTGAQITGWVDGDAGQASERVIVSGSFLEALGHNLHHPAFPAAYLGEQPDPAANVARWRTDPYAEDAARMVNYLLTQATVVSVSTSDEVNLTGFYPEGSATPIADTDDGYGLNIGPWTGYLSNALRGLAVTNLTGFLAQVGDSNRVLGRRFEFIVQQLVDGLVWAQNDGGSYPGSWYYTPNANADMLGEYAGGTIDAVEALWEAERSLARAGLIVPNLVKARNTSYIFQNINVCPAGGLGGSYVASYNGICDFGYSPAILFSLGWVGANANDATDTRLAFPSYSGITRGQLRTQFDGALLWIETVFSATTPSSIDWDLGFVEGGNFDRVDGLGDHWAMLHWTRAARAVTPEIGLYGTNDHARLFARYLLRNQASDGGWNWALGLLHAYNDSILGARGRAAMALLTLSRHGMAPTAVATASATTVAEGTPVTFTGAAFAGEATYLWNLGNGVTLDGAQVAYAYPDNGTYGVTLTVTTPAGSSSQATTVTVVNVAPVASAGPDLTVSEGTAVDFAGSFTDAGSADTHLVGWAFGDGQGAATLAAAHVYADDGLFTATLSVVDDDGGSGSATRTITVVNVPPTITSTPASAVQEGATFTYALTFTDPGTLDTYLCTAPVKPSGATLTGCTLDWTPGYVDAVAATPQVTLCVSDDDGGADCQSFELSVTVLDADADGLPDGWETLYFGGITAEDGFGDPDGDGIGNRDEFLAGFDPTHWDGPGVPTILAPACGSRMATAQPTLVLGNASHPLGSPLSYDFELFGDAAMTNLVASGQAVPAGPGYTVWMVDVALAEDAQYFWRARAGDGAVFGGWTLSACALTVDVATAGTPGPAGTQGPAGKDASGCGCSPAGGNPWPALSIVAALALRPRRRGERHR